MSKTQTRSVPTEESVRSLEVFIDGKWRKSISEEYHKVTNPSTGLAIAKIPFAAREEVAEAVQAADRAFEKWSNLPMGERLKYIFRLKDSFERHYDELATSNSENHGKTIVESRGDVRRAIDNIDSSIAAALTVSKGETFDQIATDIDESMTKDPLGVFSIICPFNFPLMIPFWFIPYAIVLGDTVVVKPSDVTPVPMDLATRIIDQEVKLPPGVINTVHGGKEVSEAMISERGVKGVAFVGSSPVAKRIYKLAGEHGKRAISNGGAKNSIVIMPDADLGNSIPAAISSFFGNAGQRCLAGSNLVTVSGSHDNIVGKFKEAAAKLRIGHALSEKSEMGPVVSANARERISKDIAEGIKEGARPVLDGRGLEVKEFPNGFYLGPTILDGVASDMMVSKKEIFGPVASVVDLDDLEGAVDFINRGSDFGNMASIFTSSGKIAREFRRRVDAGNIGVNIGVASPAANFPFGGRRGSFFGVLHAQIDTVDFFTDRKVTITRW